MTVLNETMFTNNPRVKEMTIKTTNSLLVTAETKLFVPEKRIILLDEVNEQEARFLACITKGAGKLIV